MTKEEELQALREENQPLNMQALAVYLHQGQLLPMARTCEALASICGCQISEGTRLPWSELAAERLAPTVERIAELIVASRLQHGDETGIRVSEMLHWLHVNCTRDLSHLAWHASQGREAMGEIGIWPHEASRGMHDRLASYAAYDCAHSICGAHLVRDYAAVAEQEHQEWAVEMQDFLLDLHEACQEWRLLQLSAVPAIERDEWVARSFEMLAAGYAAQPPPPTSSAGSRKGRRKQSQAKKLLDALDGACRSRAGEALRPADSLLRTTRPSGTFAWRKFSKRLLTPFGVRLGSPLFAAFAVIFLLCTSKDTPCCLLLLLSSMVNLYRSLGDLRSYNNSYIRELPTGPL